MTHMELARAFVKKGTCIVCVTKKMQNLTTNTKFGNLGKATAYMENLAQKRPFFGEGTH